MRVKSICTTIHYAWGNRRSAIIKNYLSSLQEIHGANIKLHVRKDIDLGTLTKMDHRYKIIRLKGRHRSTISSSKRYKCQKYFKRPKSRLTRSKIRLKRLSRKSKSKSQRSRKICKKTVKQSRRRKPAAAKGHKLPEPIPEGFEIRDTMKKCWIIHKIIGSGGFGTVYYAADKDKPQNFDYVVKVEYHENGPLFAEMHCYQKIAKPTTLSDWIKKKKLSYLGLSPCYGFGSFEFSGSKYRFMVIERFDQDLQKLLNENEKIFPHKTVCQIALSVIDVLEYIHSCGYIHGDVKAANLLLGRKRGTENQIYLVDMGLACKYLKDGIHKADIPDLKKAHNGTPEFASRDAHRGSFSRRSDLEILVYNMLQWLVGRLPWEDFINDNNKLQREKEKYMSDVDAFFNILFIDEDCPDGISKLVHYVNDLRFDEEPDYNKCKKFLIDDLKVIGGAVCDPLVFKKGTKKAKVLANPVKSNVSNKENGKKLKTGKKPQQVKRKENVDVQFESGMILTPAMQEILNKKQVGETSKYRKKKN